MSTNPAVAFHRNITAAWESAHDLAAQLHGDDAPSYFTGDKGNALMAALESLPLDAPPDAFVALCEAHVRGTTPPVSD